MTKLYYKDKRLASLMQEWHGVKYDNANADIWQHIDGSPKRYYVSHDSFALFSPAAGDKGMLYHWACGEIAGVFDGNDWLYMNRTPDAIICDKDENDPIQLQRIFEREGKAFFTPEREKV